MALLRSYLFAPGNDERLLAKVFDAGADAVVLDLEDAVPAGQKARARELVGAALRARGTRGRPAAFVRINATSGPDWRDDLAAVVCPALQGVRLPKAEARSDVQRAEAEIARLEAEQGMRPGSIELVCTIESARGALNAALIAAASPRMRNLCFGGADFVQDIGAEPDADETQTLLARSQLVLASRAAGIDPPIATVYRQIADLEGLKRSTEAARRLGFFGRSCIHPRQLEVVHDVFTPGPEQVARARSVVLAYQAAAAAGKGATTLADGEFVDAAVVRRAERVLELAERAQEGAAK